MNVTSLPTNCLDELPVAQFKHKPADFQVDELLGFEPDGEGEHLWIYVSKTGHNTRDLVDLLAQRFEVKAKDIGYSGLKDKHAVTAQWVSVPVAINSESLSDNGTVCLSEINAMLSALPAVEAIRVARSRKKLRTGAHRQNLFRIKLRAISAPQQVLEQRLKAVSEQGFPNYYGPQRFGRDGRNVASARSMFSADRKLSRFKRGIYLSAARSYLFNSVLAARVSAGNWNTVLSGEACILDGTNSVFHCDQPDDEIVSRNQGFDIHPSGPLYGRGEAAVSGVVAALEESSLGAEPALLQGLEKAGLKQERRSLRAIARNLNWNWPDNNTLEIEVTLQRGVYATSFLRELACVEDVSLMVDHSQKDEQL